MNSLKLFRFLVHEIKSACRQFFLRFELLDRNIRCARNSLIITPSVTRISGGVGCTIGNFTVLEVSDYPNSEKITKIELGNCVYIGEQCNIRASGGDIRISDFSIIANNVVIISNNHRMSLGAPICFQGLDRSRSGVTIGRDCWIGAHVTILPGSIIQDGAVIAAGAVVRGVAHANSVYGGVPAVEIKKRL
jgi:acetyltransferase-like isoleucine patch superfamily enzyme